MQKPENTPVKAEIVYTKEGGMQAKVSIYRRVLPEYARAIRYRVLIFSLWVSLSRYIWYGTWVFLMEKWAHFAYPDLLRLLHRSFWSSMWVAWRWWDYRSYWSYYQRSRAQDELMLALALYEDRGLRDICLHDSTYVIYFVLHRVLILRVTSSHYQIRHAEMTILYYVVFVLSHRVLLPALRHLFS